MDVYAIGGAAGAGVASNLIKKQLQLEDTIADMVVDVGMGTVAYLVGTTSRGYVRDIAAGVTNGSAALIGQKLPEWVLASGNGTTERRVVASRPAPAVRTASAPRRASGSVLEI